MAFFFIIFFFCYFIHEKYYDEVTNNGNFFYELEKLCLKILRKPALFGYHSKCVEFINHLVT